MKRYNLLLALSLTIVLFAMNSCSDNSTSVTTVGTAKLMSDYFPSAKGIWWITENYDMDTLATQLTLSSKDSIANTGTEMIDAKQAIVQITQNLTDKTQQPMTNYFYTNGGVLYNYMPSNFTDPNSPPKWLAMVDLSKSNWTIMTMDSVMNIQGIDFNVHLKFTGKKTVESGTINLFGKSWNTTEVQLNMNITMTGQVPIIGTMNIIQNQEMNLTLAKNLGLARVITYSSAYDTQSGYSKTATKMIVSDFSGK